MPGADPRARRGQPIPVETVTSGDTHAEQARSTYLIGLDRINNARYLKRELRYWKERVEEVLASGKHGYRCEATGEGAVTCGFEPREGGERSW